MRCGGGYTHTRKGSGALRGRKERGEGRGQGRGATALGSSFAEAVPWAHACRRAARGWLAAGFSGAPAHMAATNEGAYQRRRGAAKEWRKGVAGKGRRNMCKARMPLARRRSGCGAIRLERCSLMQTVHADGKPRSFSSLRKMSDGGFGRTDIVRNTPVAQTDTSMAPNGGLRVHGPAEERREEGRGSLGMEKCQIIEGAKAHAP
ncbi:hypothetical protein B0H17DRAFT_1151079 [Mycena rosella]|uniref:Uncharacterized protein n=1 Tax=Mycena rosella TaxID=1033263 RepID=A0AAD7FIL6_MYCRO|nr:hypothetical protein B0H17DRAFT_1151079 [Mycena rosella]